LVTNKKEVSRKVPEKGHSVRGNREKKQSIASKVSEIRIGKEEYSKSR